MNNDNNEDSDMWDWQNQDYCLEDNTTLEISECLLSGENKNDNHLAYLFDDETTPIKDCGDLAYQVPCTEVPGKEMEQYPDPCSQAKRRRLQFESSDVMDVSFCHDDDTFLRSQETHDSLEDAISEVSQWVAGFAEDECGVSNECLDPSSEGWIADGFLSDPNLHFSNEDISSTSGASDIQIDILDLCCNSPEYDVNNGVNRQPVNTRKNVVFKGRKSYMHTLPKRASSVVKPFAFIKPCGAHGDVTLNDINQRILTPPPKPKQKEEDPCLSYPTSAFSGKPVVGKTKIHTEGGKGSITIMRTKG